MRSVLNKAVKVIIYTSFLSKAQASLVLLDLLQVSIYLLFRIFDIGKDLLVHFALRREILFWLFIQRFQHGISRMLNAWKCRSWQRVIPLIDLLPFLSCGLEELIDVALFHHDEYFF
jgi:hypothetical protein